MKHDKRPEPAKAEVYIVGLTKVGPNRYSVVTGTLTAPVVDKVSEPLEYACDSLMTALAQMQRIIP